MEINIRIYLYRSLGYFYDLNSEIVFLVAALQKNRCAHDATWVNE